jgi:hypothetical protein
MMNTDRLWDDLRRTCAETYEVVYARHRTQLRALASHGATTLHDAVVDYSIASTNLSYAVAVLVAAGFDMDATRDKTELTARELITGRRYYGAQIFDYVAQLVSHLTLACTIRRQVTVSAGEWPAMRASVNGMANVAVMKETQLKERQEERDVVVAHLLTIACSDADIDALSMRYTLTGVYGDEYDTD